MKKWLRNWLCLNPEKSSPDPDEIGAMRSAIQICDARSAYLEKCMGRRLSGNYILGDGGQATLELLIKEVSDMREEFENYRVWVSKILARAKLIADPLGHLANPK